jgi:hypothetical protein
MTPELESAVKTFLATLASSCKDCLRKGHTCETCPASTAEELLKRINFTPAVFFETKIQKRARQKATIFAAIRRRGKPCLATEFDLGCTTAMRSMILAKMVMEGELVKVGGSKPLYGMPNKETK